MRIRERLPDPLFIATALMLCLGLSACTPPGSTRAPAEPSVEWGRKTPAALLDELKQQQGRIQDLTAHFSLNVNPPPPEGLSNLQGVIFFKRGERGPLVRIKAVAPFGRILFDMVRTGGHMEIFIPSRETLYSGDPGNFVDRKNTVGKAMMGIFKGISGARAQPESSLIISGNTVTLPLTDGELQLDRNTGFLKASVRPGRLMLYDRYEYHAGVPPIPTRIKMENTLEPGEALITLSRVRLNSDPGDIFDLSSYAPRYRLGLDALGKNHDVQ